MSDPIPKGEYTLSQRSQWPAWYIQLQFHAIIQGIWDQVDPNGKDAKPIYENKPKIPVFEPIQSPTLTQKDQREAYKLERAVYEARLATWSTKSMKLENLSNWVNQTVDPLLLAPAIIQLVQKKKATLQEPIRYLKTEMAPLDSTTITQ